MKVWRNATRLVWICSLTTTIQENDNPSDYYGFTNVTRTYSNAEEDAFSNSDITDFLDEDLEASNYYVDPDMSDKDDNVFFDSKKRLIISRTHF